MNLTSFKLTVWILAMKRIEEKVAQFCKHKVDGMVEVDD